MINNQLKEAVRLTLIQKTLKREIAWSKELGSPYYYYKNFLLFISTDYPTLSWNKENLGYRYEEIKVLLNAVIDTKAVMRDELISSQLEEWLNKNDK